MVTSRLCPSCKTYFDRMGRKDGSCAHVQRQPAVQSDYTDADLDILIGRGYHAEEVKDSPGELPRAK